MKENRNKIFHHAKPSVASSLPRKLSRLLCYLAELITSSKIILFLTFSHYLSNSHNMGQVLTSKADPTMLDYHNSDIISIPRTFLLHTRQTIRSVSLSGNKLEDLPRLDGAIPHLHILLLGKNLFRIIPPSLTNLCELERLV